MRLITVSDIHGGKGNLFDIVEKHIDEAEYFINQAEETLFCTYNSNDEVVIPKGYELKDLYNAYINKSLIELVFPIIGCTELVKNKNYKYY